MHQMWNLKKGRGAFLARYNFRNDRSYWWHLAGTMAEQSNERIAAELLEVRNTLSWMDWTPINSNCPELASSVNYVVRLLPPEWKATGQNIFVGIAPLGDLNAEAWNRAASGVVEINVQYLWALEGYVLAFDEYRSSLQRMLDGFQGIPNFAQPPSDYGDLIASWDRLDDAALVWRDPLVISPGNETLMRHAPGRRVQEVQAAEDAARKFIIAHELSHHLMAHTSSDGARRRARAALEVVQPFFSEETIGELQSFKSDWQRELQADLVAVAIMCGKFSETGPSTDKAYEALFGSFIALVCVGHGGNLEFADHSDVEETHPPVVMRLKFISDAIREWYRHEPRGIHNDHPLDLLNQLEVFASFVCAHQTGQFADKRDREHITASLLEDYLRRTADVVDVVSRRPDAVPLLPPEHRLPLGSKDVTGV